MLVRALLVVLCVLAATPVLAEPDVLTVWPEVPPGDAGRAFPAESDITKPTDGMVAGQRVMRIANVSRPTLAVYRPAEEKNVGTAVVICPGGGHHIVAYDLEGTEVAEWLNTLGITACVLKYRVPARDPQQKALAAVQDTQRALSLVRSRAAEWKLNPERIGVLGFSAGGEVAARTALSTDRLYPALDDLDKTGCAANFAILVYPAYLTADDGLKLRDDVKVTREAPPMFLVHTHDDPVTPLSSLLLAAELKRAAVRTELHLYDRGGHGYGLRKTGAPVASWPDRCATWLETSGWLKR